jgi:hypothetical protein
MPEVLVFPPHIRQAQAALVGAGFSVEKDGPAFAALMFATIAYERTPQFNHAAQLQERLAEADRENRRLTGELLREGAKVNRLSGRGVVPDYTSGPVPTYEAFCQVHTASGGGFKPDRYTWDSMTDTGRRQLMGIAYLSCSLNATPPIKPENRV